MKKPSSKKNYAKNLSKKMNLKFISFTYSENQETLLLPK